MPRTQHWALLKQEARPLALRGGPQSRTPITWRAEARLVGQWEGGGEHLRLPGHQDRRVRVPSTATWAYVDLSVDMLAKRVLQDHPLPPYPPWPGLQAAGRILGSWWTTNHS